MIPFLELSLLDKILALSILPLLFIGLYFYFILPEQIKLKEEGKK